MGRPSQIKPRSSGPARSTRREFFRRSGSTAAALAVMPGLSFAAGTNAATAEFQHGVASGDPLADRVILWTRVTTNSSRELIAVQFVIALDPELTQVVSTGKTTTGAHRDFTVKIDALNLQPNTTYYYRFQFKDALSPVGRTKTLPVGSPEHLRMAVVSCSNHAYGYFNAYRRIANRTDLDMVLHLGDYIYEYASEEYGSVRPCEPAHEIITLTDYRTRHAQYKRDADSQAMLRQHPLIAIWDDHETANNAYIDGAENHTPGTEGTWADRVNGALQAYYEWMPTREVDKTNLRRDNRRFAFGDLVDLYMLEERLNARSVQLPATLITELGPVFTQTGEFLDPNRSMLGADEETWLIRHLRNSKARWKIIGQGVMFAQVKAVGAPNALGGGAFLNPDAWDGYQPSRDRLFDAFKGAHGKKPIDNVVVLTGDIHSSWAADLTPDPNNPVAAAGGYDAATGAGSLAVEFVGTSVSSPGGDDPQGALAALLKSQNPHFKYIDLNRRGYMLLDVNTSRVVCEWWHLDTVATLDANEFLAAAYQVEAGQNRLTPVVARAR